MTRMSEHFEEGLKHPRHVDKLNLCLGCFGFRTTPFGLCLFCSVEMHALDQAPPVRSSNVVRLRFCELHRIPRERPRR